MAFTVSLVTDGLFSSAARNKPEIQGQSLKKKEQGHSETAQRRGSELMCSSGEEPHALGEGKQRKHSCRRWMCVCVCAYSHAHAVYLYV